METSKKNEKKRSQERRKWKNKDNEYLRQSWQEKRDGKPKRPTDDAEEKPEL